MKKITILSLIIALNGLILTPTSSQGIGETAPDFSIQTLSDGIYKLADQQGKVVVIFFLGNECPYCIDAAPEIESEIYEEYSDREDFSLIGIDTWAQSSAKLPSFKSSTKVTFPLGVDGSSIAKDFGISYDKLAVINKDGILIHKTSSGGASSDIDNTIDIINTELGKMATSIDDKVNSKSVVLSQNYPNPASGKTTISFNLSKAGHVDLILYDITGKAVSNLVSEERSLGTHNIEFNATNLNAGIYYYQLKVEDVTQTRKMMVR